MTCTCKECGRTYTYNDEVGYSTDHCGAYCHGRGTRTHEISCLRELLGEAEKRLLRAAELMRRNYPISATVCTELAARIKTEMGQGQKGSET